MMILEDLDLRDVSCDYRECLTPLRHKLLSETHTAKYTGAMANHAVVLVRLSQKVGDEGGLERQEADCKAYCERLGLTVKAVHREVQSAYKGKKRPVLQAALDEAAGGHLVVWKIDRLTRRGVTGLSVILHQLEADGTTLHSVTEHIDARTPMGRAVLGVLAGVAEQSSADSSLRIKRAFEEKAKAGERHVGGRHHFGWGPGEAELIKEAAAWITSGGSLRGLCKEWNSRGIKTSSGGEWQSSPLSRILRSESLIGIRVHKGDRYPAQWEPLLTEAEFSAVGAALAKNKAHPRGKATLLAGKLVCGACGKKMQSTSASEKSGRLRYSCIKEPARHGCGRVSIYRDLADAEVSRQVNEMWDRWERAAPTPPINRELELVREREALEALVHDHYVSRLIPRELFLPSYQELQDRINELEALPESPQVEARTIEAKIKASVQSVEVFPALVDGRRKKTEERLKVSFQTAWLWQRVGMMQVEQP